MIFCPCKAKLRSLLFNFVSFTGCNIKIKFTLEQQSQNNHTYYFLLFVSFWVSVITFGNVVLFFVSRDLNIFLTRYIELCSVNCWRWCMLPLCWYDSLLLNFLIIKEYSESELSLWIYSILQEEIQHITSQCEENFGLLPT